MKRQSIGAFSASRIGTSWSLFQIGTFGLWGRKNVANPRSSVLCAWLIALGAATLFVAPKTAHAQIFAEGLGSYTNGTVSEYTTSGGTVQAPLISGLADAESMAVNGSDIFVANAQEDGTVAEYTTSGATVNASLISGLSYPRAVAVSGNN
jgi:hypothetical protein